MPRSAGVQRDVGSPALQTTFGKRAARPVLSLRSVMEARTPVSPRRTTEGNATIVPARTSAPAAPGARPIRSMIAHTHHPARHDHARRVARNVTASLVGRWLTILDRALLLRADAASITPVAQAQNRSQPAARRAALRRRYGARSR